MNINNKYSIILLISSLWGLMSCNDSFMDRFPETSITDKVFFSSPGDLEVYTNGMYGYITSNYWDVASDNVIYVEDNNVYKRLRGEISPKNVGLWSWSTIRTVNYMLARTGSVKGDAGDINHYIGIARLMRAKLYYDKVKSYSDVPWYSFDLNTTDTDLLFKPQDPRTLVVDSIMADLEFAVTHIKNGSSKTRIFKNTALAMQARIALYEGTFRRYHPELGLSDADRFLNIAANASKRIIDTQTYSLSYVEVNNLPAYQSLFCSENLATNPEMIFYEDYDKALGRMHNAQAMFDWTTSLSRDLMEDYLAMVNGSVKRFQDIPDYDKKNVNEIFDNRDPRLEQTFMKPGFIRPGNTEPSRPKTGQGGYPQVKFSPLTYDQISWGLSYTDLPIIRYAEILLIYAEARAELGQFTQEDMDLTISSIRERAGMLRSSLAEWNANIDPIQESRYPNVTSIQKPVILEIRRERRVELACEGFRYDDLMRWSAGKLMEKAPEGMYIAKLGYQDITGDGQPDIAIVASKADADAIPVEDREKYKLSIYILENNTFELTEQTKGYIRQVAQVNKFKFEEPKYYYTPIDEKDIVLNANLVQNKYWVN